ncbi:Uncharacterised protein [uncultured archaeon]|nr:Uncharacterised protein [uncultured archaeon]
MRNMHIKRSFPYIVLAAIIFFSASATTLAQPLPDGSDYLGSGYPGYPYDPNSPYYQVYPNYPGSQNTPEQNYNEEGHPATGPVSSQPLSTPSGSSTEALNYAEGQSLSQQDVAATGGMSGGTANRQMAYMMVTGLQIWTRYNGMWTTDPASVFYWRSTSLLSNNDQAQTVWSWEKYPNGQVYWRNLGYRMPGYFHGRFIGDARGWHELAMWGSRSGWSNVVWIYVW